MKQTTDQKLERFNKYREVLRRCAEVSEYDRPGAPAFITLAHAFTDMEPSFRKLIDVHLPALREAEESPEKISELLFEIGVELKHILYHAYDMKFYRYIWPVLEDE